MTEAQQGIAAVLLEKLKNCWDENGVPVENYRTKITLPVLSETALKRFNEIIEGNKQQGGGNE